MIKNGLKLKKKQVYFIIICSSCIFIIGNLLQNSAYASPGYANNIVSYWKFDNTTSNNPKLTNYANLVNSTTAASNGCANSYIPGSSRYLGNQTSFSTAFGKSYALNSTSKLKLDDGQAAVCPYQTFAWMSRHDTKFTFATWYKANNMPVINDNRVFWATYPATSFTTGMGIYVEQNTRKVHLIFGNSGLPGFFNFESTATALPPDTFWHYLLVTHDGTTDPSFPGRACFYIDGNLNQCVNGDHSFTLATNNAQTPYIGSFVPGASSAWDGNFDEMAIWNSTLTQNDTNTLWNGGNGFSMANPNGNIILTPNSGTAGTNVLVNGTSFGSFQITDIYFDKIFITSIFHSGTSFNKNITIPSGKLGIHTINATDESGGHTGLATFTITSPNFSINPINGKVGSIVSTSGSSFKNNTSLQLKFDSHVLSSNPAIPITSNTGSFNNVTFNVPASIAGHHNVNVTDGFGNNGTQIFNVTSSVILTPNTGSVYTFVFVSGNGYIGTHSITIKYDGNSITTTPGSINTNNIGSFGGSSILIPQSVKGTHNITATDGSHTGSALFTVNPNISISPNTGNSGTIIKINGTGFKGISTINIYFNNGLLVTNPITVTTNSTGSFNNISITAPNLAPGTYIIKAVDSDGNIATASFTLTLVSSNAPDPVNDLHATFINDTKVGLGWSKPNLHKNILVGYQINYTTPIGTPNSILVNNTNSNITAFTVSGLQPNTTYSFRIGVWSTNSSNPYGNILNVQTSTGFIPANFTIGSVGTQPSTNINGSNPLRIPIQYVRTDNGNNTLLNVIYQNNFNLICNFNYELAQINKTYDNLPTTQFDSNYKQSTFSFVNSTNDIIQIDCKDKNTGTDDKYVLTQTNIPFVQQTKNFRNGTYGTHGVFGAIDLITLIGVILAMIGLNRISESVGAIFTIIIIGVLGFFNIMQWPSIIISVVSLVVMLAVSQTRKT